MLVEDRRGGNHPLAHPGRPEVKVASFTVEPAKLAFLNPGGLTIIAIREHHDVMISDAGPPEGQTWGFGLHTFESPIGGPWLYITAE